ncbi:DUF3237 domain-containing protein [Natronolimnohabitans innermongolicus]|uniref:Uncharacterized protein n=1 Tax=Natronolimnohabitans innermongolicus JCM 12255 TaxID=1227499 RepID=L9WNA9_9EURY|nr:DUF3237 domain-containing protein [Natronolimnohabitans innermongolicus]ELY50944.1 hypothetical protein C493_18201 [Natronolimnohabitans innermongolicus JCM 12255]
MVEDTTQQDTVPEPSFEHVLDLEIEVEEPIEIGDTGDGRRRIIPIVDGTVSGRIDGHVIPAGADYQLFRVERPTELVAKYAFETDDGSRVYVENEGIRYAPPETKKRLRDGEPVDPDEVYFQSTPRFETADPDLEWLTQSVFVASGVRQPKGVKLAVYRVYYSSQ